MEKGYLNSYEPVNSEKTSNARYSLPIKSNLRNDIFLGGDKIFGGASVLKTSEGFLSFFIYLAISTLIFFFSPFESYKHMNIHSISPIGVVISFFLGALMLSIASTSPLKNNLKYAIKKYPNFLGYIVVVFALILFLIGFTVFLSIIGLCLGLLVGLFIFFAIFYKIFLSPGLIAIKKHGNFLNCIAESWKITKDHSLIGYFIVYIIIYGVLEYIFNYAAGNSHSIVVIYIIYIIWQITSFIIAASITLLTIKQGNYTPENFRKRD